MTRYQAWREKHSRSRASSANTTKPSLVARDENQQPVERGCRFLNDPMFMASTRFLQSPKRIMALMMVMTLSRLVYAALEPRIRDSLKTPQEHFPS